MKDLIQQLQQQQDLTSAQAESAFRQIMSGQCEEEDIAAFLLALKAKGETIAEITAAATAMRAAMTPFETELDCIDVCGTGGDNKGSYNISTAVAFVLAGCGVPVAKHGNRSVSSQSGSSDVLSTLGVRLTDHHDLLRRMLDDASICFLAAPFFHPAMKHVAPVRAKLKTRTIFNLLGPLCNPAGVRHQLMGVYDRHWVKPLAGVLLSLGTARSVVIHGHDGMDELTVTGPSYACEVHGDTVAAYDITPDMAGLKLWSPEALVGGDADHNAQVMRKLLMGETGAYRDAVILNAAAGLMIMDRADDLATAAALAGESIDSGRAITSLDALITLSQEAA